MEGSIMTEHEAQAQIGHAWTDAVAALDWKDWRPVLGEDGTIDDVCPADLPLTEALAHGWVYDEPGKVYTINWDLAYIVVALLSRDPAVNGGFYEATVAIAREWLRAGFDDRDVRYWLDAGVVDADHALALQAAGLGPADTPEEWGWLHVLQGGEEEDDLR